MSREAFQKLREIDSLLKMKNKELALVKEQDDRLSRLESQKSERTDQKDQDKKLYTQTQQNLLEMEAKLKTASQQKERLSQYSPDDPKLAELSETIEKLEMDGLEMISQIDQIEQALKDHDTFLQGITKTISEISIESLETKNTHLKEISHLEMRLDLLVQELPDNFKMTYQRLMTKNFPLGPFTAVANQSCLFCRSSVSKVEESEIDTKFAIIHCKQCGRLFLPYTAVHA
jgi:predicted  nucleic acid-binding Zn-ribbon protein